MQHRFDLIKGTAKQVVRTFYSLDEAYAYVNELAQRLTTHEQKDYRLIEQWKNDPNEPWFYGTQVHGAGSELFRLADEYQQ